MGPMGHAGAFRGHTPSCWGRGGVSRSRVHTIWGKGRLMGSWFFFFCVYIMLILYEQETNGQTNDESMATVLSLQIRSFKLIPWKPPGPSRRWMSTPHPPMASRYTCLGLESHVIYPGRKYARQLKCCFTAPFSPRHLYLL